MYSRIAAAKSIESACEVSYIKLRVREIIQRRMRVGEVEPEHGVTALKSAEDNALPNGTPATCDSDLHARGAECESKNNAKQSLELIIRDHRNHTQSVNFGRSAPSR